MTNVKKCVIILYRTFVRNICFMAIPHKECAAETQPDFSSDALCAVLPYIKSISKGVISVSRSILHVDCNNFFASVESIYDPGLKKVPCAVAGSQEQRHGIILAKNEIAKKYGVRTGEAIWEAKQKCPQLVTVEPHFERYEKYSKLFKGICFEYTDRIESFGIDECWLDVTGNRLSALEIAEKIRRRVREEYGLTVSVGVSFNKVFAKLGSDMKKPDAVTIINEDDFREKIWHLPVESLLGVGRATLRRLKSHCIDTIGELAEIGQDALRVWLGKSGEDLWRYANGLDCSEVMRFDEKIPPKSVSSGTTPYRNLVNENDVRGLVYALSEDVAAQLRMHELKCRLVTLGVRNTELEWNFRQCRLNSASADSKRIAEAALELYFKYFSSMSEIHSINVGTADLVPYCEDVQLDFYGSAETDMKRESINRAVDMLHTRYGNGMVRRAVTFQDFLIH